MAKLRRWPAAIEPSLLPDEPRAVAVGDYHRYCAALFRLFDDPDAPIDNSPTERESQTVAKSRVNRLSAGSTEDVQAHAAEPGS